MAKTIDIFKIVSKIKKDSKNAESYHTGLLGEQMIVSSYKQMPLDKLIMIRYIINKIIHKKKEEKRILENGKSDN